MSKLDKDTVLENFTQAYTKANGKAPTIEAKGGWYSVDGDTNVRLAQIEEMTAELSNNKTAKKAEKPAEKADKPVKKETQAKKAPEAKKSATKKSAGKKAASKKATGKKSANKKSSGETFSVKDFYTQQILAINPGAIPPR